MSALAIFLWLLVAVVGMAMPLAVVGIALLLYASAKAEAHAKPEREDPYPQEAAEAPDQIGADILPDGSPAVQRSRLWPPSCRLREDYVEAAESAYDWKAAEADATKRRSR